MVTSPAFGPLTAALRRAEAYQHDLEGLVPRVVSRHGLGDADDIAAVLRYRVDKTAAGVPRGCRLRPRLIAGLIPEPLGEMAADDRQAIDQRKAVIEARARALVEIAVGEDAPWIRRLGERPVDPAQRERWLLAAASVAAYRDRYKIVSGLPLAGSTANDAQHADRQRAQVALREAVALSTVSGNEARAVGVDIRALSGP